MRNLTRFAILAERPASCAARLRSYGVDFAVANEIAFYLDQANDLDRFADQIILEFAAYGVAARIYDPGQGLTWLDWLRQDPNGAMVWNMTDGISYFLGSAVPAAASLSGIISFGAPLSAQALVQDKFKLFAVAQAAGIRVAATSLARGDKWLSNPPGGAGPYFVKPATLGAKIGIWPDSKCQDLESALELSCRIQQRYGDDAVIQPYIDGQDIRVCHMAVSPDPKLERLGMYELRAGGGDGFMTLADSYKAIQGGAGAVKRIAHADIEQASRRLADLIGLRDVFSLDFRLDREGQGWLLECEVCPAVTIYDFAPYLADYWDCRLPEALGRAVMSRFAAASVMSSIR